MKVLKTEVLKTKPLLPAITDQQHARIAELEDELERAKVCGSCAHWDPVRFDCKLRSTYDKKRPWSGYHYNFNHCHFAQSRWTPCGKERSKS